jgi:hypothetical protein
MVYRSYQEEEAIAEQQQKLKAQTTLTKTIG